MVGRKLNVFFYPRIGCLARIFYNQGFKIS